MSALLAVIGPTFVDEGLRSAGPFACRDRSDAGRRKHYLFPVTLMMW